MNEFCHFVHQDFFFPRHYFGNLFCFFSYPHYSTIPQQQNGSNHVDVSAVSKLEQLI
jgi:hypothetical protein